MNRQQLIAQIKEKQSFLCVGLDTDIAKIPLSCLLKEKEPVFVFNKAIIDATLPYTVAYKLNIAFYESLGPKGWIALQKTEEYLRTLNVLTIADGKRGDIGNTSEQYAKTFFDPTTGAKLDFHALTVAPYMGSDSVRPFLKYQDKWVILLALTSNEGSKDFQLYAGKNNLPLFKKVLTDSKEWGSIDNMMYVIGATRAEQLSEVREIIPEHFLLVPGVGAQGGNLEEVSKYGMTKDCGLLVNNSRGIIFASDAEDFAAAAGKAAQKMQLEMADYLKKYSTLAA